MTSNDSYSVVEELVNGRPINLQGEGELKLQDGQEDPPNGPGRVQFRIHYAPDEVYIKLTLKSLDDGGKEILEWRPIDTLRTVSPSYDLIGSVNVREEEQPISMEAVLINYNLSLRQHALLDLDHVLIVTVGPGVSAPLKRARVLIPNFIGEEAQGEVGSLHFHLFPVSWTEQELSVGKILPGSYLELVSLEGTQDDVVRLAIETFGWFLSFYAGRLVHPIAWEGETENGPVWCIPTRFFPTPLPVQDSKTCLRDSSLELFLKQAWESWLELAQERRARLKSVVALYEVMLATPVPLQQISLTAMYLERFREQVLGSSELFPVTESFNPSRRRKVEGKLRATLKEAINSIEQLDDNQKDTLQESLKANPGKVRDLFRQTFKESLLELYKRADLKVDRETLKQFIDERDKIIHGTWPSDRKGEINTYFCAQYGLNLLEKLILRFFSYEGEYYDRVSCKQEWFSKGNPIW